MKITKKLLTLFLSVMLLVTGFSNNVGLTQVLADDNNPNDNPYLYVFNEISGHTGGLEYWEGTFNYGFNYGNDLKGLREDSVDSLRNIGLDCSRGTYAFWARGTMKKYMDEQGMTKAQASAQVAKDLPITDVINAFDGSGSWSSAMENSDKFEKVYDYNKDGALTASEYANLGLQPGSIVLFQPQGSMAAHWAIVLGVKDGYVYTGDLSAGNRISIFRSNMAAGSSGVAYIYEIYSLPSYKDVSVQINKTSANPSYTNGNALYSLEGATFDVYIDGNYTNKIGTLTTDKSGKASATYTVDSSVSKLWVKETKGPNNYLTNDDPWTSADISSSNKATFNVKNKPANDPIGIVLEKVDADAEWVEANGTPSLAGAQFTIKYFDNTKGDISGTPKATWVIESKKVNNRYRALLTDKYLVAGSDALYKNSAGLPTIPIGTISIQETKAPENYTTNGDYLTDMESKKTLNMKNGVAVLRILKDDTASEGASIESSYLTANNTYIKEEKMIYGGFKLQKRDITSGQATPLGGASLGEVVVELYNDNSASDVANGVSRLKYENQKQSFNPGELMITLTADENGLVSLPGDALSAGKYRLVEKTAPKGYLNEGVTEAKFTIENDGEIVDLTKQGNAIENKPMRGDVSIRKIREDNQKGMAGIQFEIKSNTTGETHIITTDENGFASTESAYAPHTKNTNSGEAGDGVWFGLYKLDGSDEYTEMVEPDDSVGALPFDTYTITELRGENNKDVATMYTDTFSIYADKRVINLGNIENTVVNLRTKATNEDGKKIVPAVPNTKLIDTVTIQGLTIGNTYTISGVLMDKETGEELVGEDNQPITASKEFKATAKNMEVEVLFRFDASVHGGKEIVVFETLKDKATDTEVARHEDLEDEAQTVTTPEVKTTAKDTETGEHTVVSRENIVIEDVVKYKNFEEGKSYVVQGTLMNKATGEKLLDADGKEIVSEPVKFRAGVNGEGEVTIKFEFNGVNMKKITAVAFEEVTYQDNLFAVHADLDDPDQTVYFPELGTVAIGDNNTHNVVIGEESTIIDTVKYTNVDPNATYVVKGQVYDKTTGELIEGAVAESEPFVPGASEGEVEVAFTVDTTERAKHELVIFEELYLIPADETKPETPVAEHKDPEDKNQTVFVEVPEVEKYINKDVHEELELFREEFTYDVMGYVTNDAEQVTFYDDLVDILEFVSTNEDVQVSVHDTNDHTVHGTVETEGTPIDAQVTINNQSLEVFIEDATEYRGKWIKVTFDARIKDTYKTIEALKRQEGQWLVIEDDINVLGGVTPHEGVENTARYTITVNNEGKHNEKTNTVTITPPVPEIKTSASNAEDGTQQMLISKEMHIIDKVMYRNVEPGDYKLYGTLMIKKTGKPVQVDGKDLVVVKEVTVAEDEREGVWEMDFEFNGYDLEEGDLVVFEKLTTIDPTLTNEKNPDGEEVVIAEHADMNDGDQTIILTDVIPEIGTKATFADGKKSQKVGGVATVNDTVTYKGLRKGETYVMKGTLMDKETGKSISKAFTVEFTAEARDGEVVVPIKVDTKGLGGKTGVVFEECYRKEGNIKIAEHKDINDEAQTVFFIKALLTKIVTGSSAPYLIGGTGIVALALLYFVLKKKSDKKD